MQIVLLCGGLGTRLKSVVGSTPKGLIKINNKHFIEYIFESFLEYKIKKVHLCLGFGSQKYIELIKKLNTPFEISYSIEKEDFLLGTGGALKNSLEDFEDNFIVQYGDSILGLNYKKLYNKHLNSGKDMTMSILSKDHTSETPNMRCTFDQEGNINCIYDKFDSSIDANYIDYGALVFKKCIFKNIREDRFDLASVQKNLTKEKRATFFEVKKPYIEIGNPRSLEMAKFILK